jgi:hypothetical protein
MIPAGFFVPAAAANELRGFPAIRDAVTIP